MTPDELRRMDNDLCIIYEKGLKPIKAKKYYYFETPMIKKLNEYSLHKTIYNCTNHRNISINSFNAKFSKK